MTITRDMIERARATTVCTQKLCGEKCVPEYWPAVLFHEDGVPVLLGKDGEAVPSPKEGSALQRAEKMLVTLKKTWHEKHPEERSLRKIWHIKPSEEQDPV